MSGSFSGVPNNLHNFSGNMDKSTAQQYACDSTGTIGSPSQASQTRSHISTSHMDAIQHYGCSLPLANTSSYRLSPPQFNNSWSLDPWSLEIDLERFFSVPQWGTDESPIIENPTGDCMDEHLADENYIDENPLFSASFHVPESGFNANDATPKEPLGCFANSEPLASELLRLGGFRYSTSSRAKGGPVSGDDRSVRERSKSSPTNPRKYANDSDGNSNDSKVIKTKKTYQCDEYNCGKTFGRSAELKRHKSSVHRGQIAAEKRPELFNCHHEGCERVGEAGFKRKDNLVQHLRGVHGDKIEKSGRRSMTTRMSPVSSPSNAGAGSPTMATGYEQFSQGQQDEPFVYADQQPAEEGSGTPPFSRDFWESLRL